ncbi:hypothetical protein L3i22_045740 [Actinoplanes sp. L3-i22]|nr:hypothetical protein L3i22_045740 [Actinoplanes sp. L3-i22]
MLVVLLLVVGAAPVPLVVGDVVVPAEAVGDGLAPVVAGSLIVVVAAPASAGLPVLVR